MSIVKKKAIRLAIAFSVVALVLSGCASPAPEPSVAGAQDRLSIAYFGAASANAFTQAGLRGVQKYADLHNADVTQFDGKFDGPTQVSQIQDATVSGKYDVFIIYANDGTIVVPAVEDAIAQGIVVLAFANPIGSRYDTAEPQVDGAYFVGDVPTDNGEGLATMALQACKTVVGDCKVAYLKGSTAPFDNARTQAFIETMKKGGVTDVIDNFVGGYTPDAGRKVGQDLLQAAPDVDVIVASGAATEGLEKILPPGMDVKLIGSSTGSTYAVKAVQEGRWFGVYYLAITSAGERAAEIGLGAARGKDEPHAVRMTEIVNTLGTQETLVGLTGEYDN